MQERNVAPNRISDRNFGRNEKGRAGDPARPLGATALRKPVYGVTLEPMYGARPGVQAAGAAPEGQTGTPPVGPIRPEVLVFVVNTVCEQPLPSHAASKS